MIRLAAQSLRKVQVNRSVLMSCRGAAGFLSENDFLVPGAGSAAGQAPSISKPAQSVAYSAKPEYSFKMGVHLTKYGTDLTKMAIEGKIETVIGRDNEIQQAIQVLSRRRKNNPCLIGEPGVGKTAIAEGLANLIAKGNVPDSMKDKAIISLDLAGMLAGTKFRGEFEDRLKGCLKEIESCGDKVILFIDELHVIVGAGGSEGGIDASNILKPSLARGKLRCLGTTTSDEYSKRIEKDTALARRFQAVFIPEPSEADTVKIIEGLRWKYESHHSIQIPDEAIACAVQLAGRYITSRKFPDKAIDLIDEASARLRNRIESKPARLVEVEKQLDVARSHIHESILSGKDAAVKDELAVYQLNEEATGLKEAFSRRREVLGNIFELKHLVEGQQEEIARLKDLPVVPSDKITEAMKTIADYHHRIAEMYKELHHPDASKAVLETFTNMLTAKDIAEIVSQSTGIPVTNMLNHDERKALLDMDKELVKQVIGQQEAIHTISKCIRLSRAGLRYHERPIGVFLFLGPTGVGKTELAKAVASILFKDHPSQSSLLRIDMSEYMERFSVSRLIGAPPGYVGYDEGGVLTDAVRRRPYQLLLLDEFEKAHREVSNLLLQVFDEGRLTDSQGREVDFRNTVIIMTSNLGSDILAQFDPSKSIPEGSPEGTAPLTKKQLAMKIVHQHFSPEFVNRLDDVIVFNPLDTEALKGICEIQVSKVRGVLKDKGISFHISSKAINNLINSSADMKYGARPLKRVIQNSILTPLASAILEGTLTPGGAVYLSATGDAMEYMQSLNADVDPLEGLTTIFKDADDSLGLEFALRNCSQ